MPRLRSVCLGSNPTSTCRSCFVATLWCGGSGTEGLRLSTAFEFLWLPLVSALALECLLASGKWRHTLVPKLLFYLLLVCMRDDTISALERYDITLILYVPHYSDLVIA